MEYSLNDPTIENDLRNIRQLLDSNQLSEKLLPRVENIALHLHQQFPSNPEILEILIEILFLKNNLKEVIKYNKILTKVTPNNGNTYYFCGKILMVLKNYSSAIIAFKKALELKCHKPDLMSLLITAYMMSKDKKSAILNYLTHNYPDSSKWGERQVLITQIISAKEYCKKHNKFFKIIHDRHKVELELKKTLVYPDREVKETEKTFYNINENYITYLENVIVVPPNYTIITEEEYHIYDGLDTNSRSAMLLMEPYKFHTADDQVLVDITKKKLVIDEEVILFGGGCNFSHCINDWMSKLYILEQYQEINHLSLLVSKQVPPPIIELFDLFGISKNRIRKIDHTAVLRCKKLWVPSLSHQYQLISPAYLNYFTKKVSQFANKNYQKKRLYFGRESTTYRKLTNQNKLWKMLEKYDFEMVIPEKLSIRKQINLCYNAEIIICILGGASAALLFTSPDTIFIELTHPSMQLPQYIITASLKGNPFYQVIGNTEPINRGRFQFDRDFNIPVNRVEDILKNLLS